MTLSSRRARHSFPGARWGQVRVSFSLGDPPSCPIRIELQQGAAVVCSLGPSFAIEYLRMLSYLPNISYLGIVAVLVFTGTGFPIPEEVPVILAGMASNPGYLSTPLNPWLALLCCIGGAMGGDCVMYAIGYHFGHGVLRDHPWFARFIRPEHEQRVEQMIRKHGFKVFFIARFLVGLRSPVFLTAGILRVPFRRFIVVDAISAFAVVTTFFAFSYCFADHIVSWFKYIRGFEWTLTALVVGGSLFLLFRFWRRRAARLQRIQLKRERRARRLAIGDVEPTPAAPAETQL